MLKVTRMSKQLSLYNYTKRRCTTTTSHSAPIQPTNIGFPKRSYSDRGRSFNPSWFSQYNWLEYSLQKDAAFCFPCRWFGASSIGRSRPETTFTITGFRDRKHATGSKVHFFAIITASHTRVVLWHGTSQSVHQYLVLSVSN